MDDSERVELIRRGNELFNARDYKSALKIFLSTSYKDGIIRVADYLYFDVKDKVAAVKLYKRAGHQKVIDEFAERAAQIIHSFLEEDKKLEAERKKVEETFVKEWKPATVTVEDLMNLAKKEEKEEDKK